MHVDFMFVGDEREGCTLDRERESENLPSRWVNGFVDSWRRFEKLDRISWTSS